VTDNYGDFKFDGLEPNSGRYTIEVAYRDRPKKVIEADLTTSLNLGVILV
jgi:hypothetical protein